MPASVYHVLTATTPDDPLFEIVPSNWNSAHAVALQINATEISNLFSNKNGVSFGLDGTNITASVVAAGAVNFSAGTTSGNLASVVFGNGGGVSFGLNGSTITGSYSQSTHSHSTAPAAFAAGTQTATSGTIQFADSNGLAFGMNNGTVTGSYTQSTHSHSTAPAAFAAGTQTGTSGTIALLNGNGISFGMNGSTGITASYTVPSTAGLISAVNLSAGTTSSNLAAATFANGNGVSFGLNGAGVLTASVKTDYQSSNANYLTSQSNQAISGSNGSFAFQTATFGNLNGLSFYTSNGSLVGSYTVPTQSNQTIGLYASSNTTLTSSGTVDARSLSFRGAGVASVGFSAGEFIISVPSGGGGITNINVSAGTTSNNLSNVVFGNGNGITFGLNGSTVTASHNGLTTARASNDALGLNTAASNVTWTANSAGVSIDARGYAGTGTTFAGTNVSASATLNSNGLNLALSAAAGGGGAAASASNGSFAFTTINFSNANNVTFGTSAGGIITASVAAPGAAAENNWFNLLGANTAGNTTASGSTIGLSGVNMTLSGTNGSQIVMSVPATSSLVAVDPISLSTNGSTVSLIFNAKTYPYWNPQDGCVQVAGQQGNASMHIQPARAPNVTFDRVAFPVVLSNSSNSSGTVTISFQMGIYTRNGSTLSLLMSTSNTQAFTFSGTVNNSTYAGMRLLTMPWSTSLAEGQYYVGIHSRTTTGGGNATFSQYLASQVNSVFSGIMGAASNASIQYTRGLGHYSATFSTAVPSSVGLSQIQGSQSVALRQPVFYMVNGTF